jgi:hypothetical protein
VPQRWMARGNSASILIRHSTNLNPDLRRRWLTTQRFFESPQSIPSMCVGGFTKSKQIGKQGHASPIDRQVVDENTYM